MNKVQELKEMKELLESWGFSRPEAVYTSMHLVYGHDSFPAPRKWSDPLLDSINEIINNLGAASTEEKIPQKELGALEQFVRRNSG